MLNKGQRNTKALSENQILYCQMAWDVLGGNDICLLDTSEANINCSKTRFLEETNIVMLGADVYPGNSLVDARSRMSAFACLAHEFGHAERSQYGIDRDIELRDEAEASIHGSWNLALNPHDRRELVEDAKEILEDWLQITHD